MSSSVIDVSRSEAQRGLGPAADGRLLCPPPPAAPSTHTSPTSHTPSAPPVTSSPHHTYTQHSNYTHTYWPEVAAVDLCSEEGGDVAGVGESGTHCRYLSAACRTVSDSAACRTVSDSAACETVSDSAAGTVHTSLTHWKDRGSW